MPVASLECDRELSPESAKSRATNDNASAASRARPAVGIQVGTHGPAVPVVAVVPMVVVAHSIRTVAVAAVALRKSDIAAAAVALSIAAVVPGAVARTMMTMRADPASTAPPDCDRNREFVPLSPDRYVDDSDKLGYSIVLLEKTLKLSQSARQSERDRSGQRQLSRNRLTWSEIN